MDFILHCILRPVILQYILCRIEDDDLRNRESGSIGLIMAIRVYKHRDASVEMNGGLLLQLLFFSTCSNVTLECVSIFLKASHPVPLASCRAALNLMGQIASGSPDALVAPTQGKSVH